MLTKLLCVIVFYFILKCCHGDLKQNSGLQSARCKTKCVTKYANDIEQLEENYGRGKLKITIENCAHVPKCRSCIKPCDTDTTDILSCSDLCAASQIECLVSCLFLADSDIHKSGRCPVQSNVQNFGVECTQECRNDGQCPDVNKCCKVGCGYTCVKPEYSRHDGLNPVPQNVKTSERRQGRAVRVHWDMPMGTNNASRRESTLFVVQMRRTLNSVRGIPIWNEKSTWTDVKMTHHHGVMISRVIPGHYYQFRVASVNEHGSKGFSVPSTIFKSSRDVSRPTPPQNVSEGVSVVRDKHVDVTIHWKPPKRSDIPIWRYTVYWSERLRIITPVLVRIDVLEQTVPSYQHNFTIRGLNFGSTYFIQVAAIARLRNKIMKSRRTSLYIHTYTPPGHKSESPFDAVTSYNPDLIQIWNLTLLGNVHYSNGDVTVYIKWKVLPDDENSVDRYMVYWSPEYCDQDYTSEELSPNSATTHDTFFELYKLKYECSYIVKVMASNLDGQNGNPVTLRFQTPMCSEVFVKGEHSPICPERNIRPPKKPPDISYTLTVNKCNISVKVTWKSSPSDLPVLSYSIVWYKGHLNFLDPTYSATNPNIRLVPSSTNSIRLTDLEEKQFYVIQVKAISILGYGGPAVVHLWTPQLESFCSNNTNFTYHLPNIPHNKTSANNSPAKRRHNDTQKVSVINVENSANTLYSYIIIQTSLIYYIFNIVQRLSL